MKRPPVLTMTDAAVAQAKTLLARGDSEILALRVGVKTGGCSGLMYQVCLLYTSPSPRDRSLSRMPSSA